MKSKYLYVIYPGACGGNHVCNMISLCDGFEPRSPYKVELGEPRSNFKTWLLNKYKNYDYVNKPIPYVNAHLNDNLRGRGHVDYIFDHLSKDSVLNTEQTLIIQGHIANFFAAIDKGIIEEIGTDYSGIVMTYPPEDSMPWNRIQAYGYHSPLQNYKLPLGINRAPFSKGVEDVFIIDNTNGLEVDTVKFFTPEGSQYLRELLKEKFDVDLPLEADELHRIWFTWMEHVVDPKTIEQWNNSMNDKKYSDYFKLKSKYFNK